MPRYSLRIHQFIPSSRANGPGTRAVLWVQGCSLACPGCFNPETHPAKNGERLDTDLLADQIASIQTTIEGITISGGEPFQQVRPLLDLLERIRAQTKLSVIVFSGYHRSELETVRFAEDALKLIDILIAGRYEQDKRIAQGLLGSTNKSIFFLTQRYQIKDLEQTPISEVLINPDGEVQLTGIDPIIWQTPTNHLTP
jgi:anaerobic ribonucleoside-triphosphate reductase activating protein